MTTQTISNYAYTPGPVLFNRTYSLAVGAPGQTSAIQFTNLAYSVSGQFQPPSPFRITFDIDRNLIGASPNKAKIEIYNMQSQNRSKIKAGYVVQLKAGYTGLMDTIFTGNISSLGGIKNDRRGPDVITSFECSEGEASIVMSRLDKSYPAGTTLQSIVSDLAAAMQLGVFVDKSVSSVVYSSPIPTVTYGRGFVAHGPCKDTLTKVLKNAGLRWVVQNGNINILSVNAATNTTKAILISSGVTASLSNGISTFDPKKATGLIGVPSVGQNFITFSCLLNPQIRPGGYVQLQCEDTTINGFYKVNRTQYQGDTHSKNKWHILCETTTIKPLPGVAAA